MLEICLSMQSDSSNVTPRFFTWDDEVMMVDPISKENSLLAELRGLITRNSDLSSFIFNLLAIIQDLTSAIASSRSRREGCASLKSNAK